MWHWPSQSASDGRRRHVRSRGKAHPSRSLRSPPWPQQRLPACLPWRSPSHTPRGKSLREDRHRRVTLTRICTTSHRSPSPDPNPTVEIRWYSIWRFSLASVPTVENRSNMIWRLFLCGFVSGSRRDCRADDDCRRWPVLCQNSGSRKSMFFVVRHCVVAVWDLLLRYCHFQL
jgi:hypothetical protein